MGSFLTQTMDEIKEIIVNGLTMYPTEFFVLIILCTLIYLFFHYINKYINSGTKTIIYNHPTYQTRTDLHNFRISSPNLSKNNAVYLTNFKSDGLRALLMHIIYGYILYFIDPINLFCLFVSIGQIYEYFDFRSVIPLSIFATISMFNHVYSMSVKLNQQHSINRKNITKSIRKKGTLDDGKSVDVYINKIIPQMNLKRGDWVKLNENTEIPADILLFNSNVLVQEIELTGEDIIISKIGLNVDLFSSHSKSLITINHHKNEGAIELNHKMISYSSKNMIFRGTKIIDGDTFGIVIETGNDCQIYRIDNNSKKDSSNIQKNIINICITNLYFMLILASFTGIIIYSKNIMEQYSYKKLLSIIRKMIILFNTMVPLSLQFFFSIGSGILSKRIANKNKITVNRNGIMAFQTDPHFIVSDKTGTITTNELDIANIFVNCDENTHNHRDIYRDHSIDILNNILACTEIQPHSKTGQLMKNDIVEEKLLSFALQSDKGNRKLVKNIINNDGSGYINVLDYDNYERLYYKPYDYKLEVKIGVIKKEHGSNIELHIQGTPEAIDRYSNGKLAIILTQIESMKVPNNVYKRVIAHASKIITHEELLTLKNNPQKILRDFEITSVYIFYDYVIEGINQSIDTILEMGKDFAMLTGDKMSSAVEIGKTIGIIKHDNDVTAVDNIDDLTEGNFNEDKCYIINGRLLEDIICSNKTTQLAVIIQNSKRRIIYRASPNGKQLFISFLKKWFNRETMMIGDGSNDISAIVQANIGVGIERDNNHNVQNIAEITIDNWNKIPQLLTDFKEKQSIIKNVAQWVLMKHMITAFALLVILMASRFENIRDPASPYIMSILNGFMFICMCVYCQYTNIIGHETYTPQNVYKMIIKGILLGIFNSLTVLTFIDIEQINMGVKILIFIQAIELAIQLYNIHQSHAKK